MKKSKVLEFGDHTYIVIDPQLGQGGAGTVCSVKSTTDGRVYALKKIKKDSKSGRNERFRQEINFGLTSNNDHVVKIHAQFDDENYFYYTMDLYPKNLRHIIEEDSTYLVILDYLSQLCEGLAYVHAQGVVHRDIKPENILVDINNRRVVLADFGIAHFKDSNLTEHGDLLANRNYQAPEQMVKDNAKSVGMPADIFALGLIFTEVFTKQNARGVRYRRISDIYPFLSNLDLLVEGMTLQDPTQRITIQAVQDSLDLIRSQVAEHFEEILEELHPLDEPINGDIPTTAVLEQAIADVLSAKYIFERTTDKQLSRYNPNYHCQINYSVRQELYNGCVQSFLYSMCKAKFENEANSTWNESDIDLVVSTQKASLLNEFKSIQNQYPLRRNSLWASLPQQAAHYFRFCKDYHCKELLEQAHRELAVSNGSYAGTTLHSNLMNAPILWIVQNLRRYLKTDRFEMSMQTLQEIDFERQVLVDWEGTDWDNPERMEVGLDLFEPSNETDTLAILTELNDKWNTSFLKKNDDMYTIYFNDCDNYAQFRRDALAKAAQDHLFEGDVLDLLRPDAAYGDIVALTWGSSYDIPNTLAKILGIREP